MLAEVDRRILANLTLPRNPDDVSRCMYPIVQMSSDDVNSALRGPLSDSGWVVNMGEHTDAAKLASQVQKSKQALDIPDEKAEIYARRMKRHDLMWRMGGELWMLTNEGLEELKREPDDAPAPMVPSQVQAAIDSEWARVHRGSKKSLQDSDGTALGGAFANEEDFLSWAIAVADDCEKRWSVRPTLPVAGGASGWSDAYEIIILDAENQKASITAAAPLDRKSVV